MPRAKKICARPGCPAVADGSYCPTHRREADKARGSREQRGYGTEHVKLRKQWAPIVASGAATCARCKQPIKPNEPWDLGHDDHDRSKYNGPEHAYRCNRSAAGRKAHGI